ncbi:MAG: hypothetical protein IAG13_04305 [Deltaproteobacteria bacterium]|nr:hypothetical protein [Nannocystaceae bacterium]
MSVRARYLWLWPWLAAVVLAAGSCSASYEVEFHVTLGDGIQAPPGTNIAFVVAHGQPLAEAISRSSVPIEAGKRQYLGKGSACCAPEPTVSLLAFVDRDGDNVMDADEPSGVDPRNPITLTDTQHAFRSDIVIAAAQAK